MEATSKATTATKPLKVFRLENVSASVFANDREVKGEPVTFYNVTVTKLYKKDGKTLRTQSFGSEDIGKLSYVLSQARAFIEAQKK